MEPGSVMRAWLAWEDNQSDPLRFSRARPVDAFCTAVDRSTFSLFFFFFFFWCGQVYFLVQITKQAVCDSVRESLILFVSLLSVNHSMQRPAVVGAAGKLEGGAAAGRRAVQRPARGLCGSR